MSVQKPDLFAFQEALSAMLFSERTGRLRLLEETVRRRLSAEVNCAWPDLLLFVTQADLDAAQFGGGWKRLISRDAPSTARTPGDAPA